MPLTGVPFAGETIEVTIRASRTSGQVVRAGTAQADFWAPGSPLSGPPDHVLQASWSDATRGFTVLADTTGWEPGTWTYRGFLVTQTEGGPVTGLTEFTPLPLRLCLVTRSLPAGTLDDHQPRAYRSVIEALEAFTRSSARRTVPSVNAPLVSRMR